MATVLLTLGAFLILPVVLLLINSFNTAHDFFVDPFSWGLDNWYKGFSQPGILTALRNSVVVWCLVAGISFPIAVLISWILARTNIPFSHSLEFLFWVSFMMPGIATTIGWIMLTDPRTGFLNTLVMRLPFIETAPFDIYSVAGIVWAHLMTNGISVKVMLMTPAFRNMDAVLEQAARVSGASSLVTMIRITLPLMIAPMALVFALQLLRLFQSFEIEFLLGTPIGFFVYSTKIYSLVREEFIPQYGQATVLASLTLLFIGVIIPLQRWILHRRRYTTITGSFKPGLIDLGTWRIPVFLLVLGLLFFLTIAPVISMIVGSFMFRAGFFDLNTVWTTQHWRFILNDGQFLKATFTTLKLALTSAVVSPLLFSIIAYLIVRTRSPGRSLLDTIIWISGAIPGILSGLGLMWLFLGNIPGTEIRPLLPLFGTMWVLILVVVIQGNTTGVNILKGAFVQIGSDMEEAARVAGAGWVETYFKIWLPLLMPTLILLATFNFVIAAGTTGSIILLASRDTVTLSLLALEYSQPGLARLEAASIVSLVVMVLTVGVAVLMRAYGLRMGITHEQQHIRTGMRIDGAREEDATRASTL